MLDSDILLPTNGFLIKLGVKLVSYSCKIILSQSVGFNIIEITLQCEVFLIKRKTIVVNLVGFI